MNGLRAHGSTSLGIAGIVLGAITAAIIAVWLLLGLSVLVSWVQRPARYATGLVDLTTYGAPGIAVRLVYPTRLEPHAGPTADQAVTVFAVAESPEDVRTLSLALPLEGAAAYFADLQGQPVPGRLQITPGYPDPLPYTLYLLHGDSQLRGGLLLPRELEVRPTLLLADGPVPVPSLTLQVALPGRLTAAVTEALSSLKVTALPYLAMLSVGVLGAWIAVYGMQRRQTEYQQRLRDLYHHLQEYIRLEQWPDARQAVESIRLIEPGYRDVPLLESRIQAEQDAEWRKEKLFRGGLEAYRQGNWREAAKVFAEVEAEDPYYRDVHYMLRTAALYADLCSRDRSRRAAAASQLGEVGDLVRWEPLLDALGDHSSRVAEAAEHAFQQIGPILRRPTDPPACLDIQPTPLAVGHTV